MKNVINPVVVIPVYKPFLKWEDSEILSFRQCIYVLGHYDIKLIGPKSLNWNLLKEDIRKNFKHELLNITFANEYFANIAGYNKLLKSLFFFKTFKEYSHLLIYQLDAFVFRDELKYWCEQGYDYYGAPWIGKECIKYVPKTGVGNGGFSLRNVKGSLSLSRDLKYLEILNKYCKFNNKAIFLRFPLIVSQLIKSRNAVSSFQKNYSLNEDYFWGIDALDKINSFISNSFLLNILAKLFIQSKYKTAPPELAVKFSFELNPKYLFKINNNKLPFGCHAWNKYDYKFWSRYIIYNETIKN